MLAGDGLSAPEFRSLKTETVTERTTADIYIAQPFKDRAHYKEQNAEQCILKIPKEDN